MTEQTNTAPRPVRELPPNFRLSYGSHSSFEEGMCAMEAVAYIAGEPHSDHPSCASPVLTTFCIRLNDRWKDDERQQLLAVIPKLVGTRGDYERHVKQAFVLCDAHIREIVPMILDARKWNDLGDRLRGCAPVVDPVSARAARTVCIEVREEARKRRSADAYAAYAYAYGDAAAYAYAYAYAYAAAAAAYADADAAAAAAAYADADAAAAARQDVVKATLAALERAIAA